MRLRELLATNKELTARLDDLEQRVSRKLSRHDEAIAGILDAIRQLMAPPPSNSRPIGFIAPEDKGKKASRATGKT